MWTLLPIATWLFPSIGHVGIGEKEGVLRDYIDDYRINEKYLAFGNPTKYVELEAIGRELA